MIEVKKIFCCFVTGVRGCGVAGQPLCSPWLASDPFVSQILTRYDTIRCLDDNYRVAGRRRRVTRFSQSVDDVATKRSFIKTTVVLRNSSRDTRKCGHKIIAEHR